MKKFLVLALVAMIGATAFSKTIDEMFNAFQKADNVQEMVIDESMINMAMSMGADQSGALKDIKSMRIVTIENPSSEQFATAKSIIEDGVDGFDVMVDATEKDESALILTQGDGEVINKMLIIAVEDDSVAIVLMEGSINPEYANKYMNFGK